MADRRKNKRKRDEVPVQPVEVTPTKEQYSVAKWMKKHVPTKRTKFLSHNVEYFTSARAIDLLLDSHWGKGDEPLFSSRDVTVDYLDTMLRLKFFHRAKKITVTEQELKGKRKKDEKRKKEEAAESSHAEDGKKEDLEKKESNERKKRKIRLDMHLEQMFVDGAEAFVWIYDPIPFYYWIVGGLLVFGAIAICLFPLWPPFVRKGVYYLSVAAACFLAFILALAVIRVAIFCLLWLVTFGKHHLWLLPNLTEDVGFFASFWPLWKYECRSKETKKGGAKKDKDSDSEEQPLVQQEEQDRNEAEQNSHTSESESEGSSQKSQTGKDFELVDREEVLEDSD